MMNMMMIKGKKKERGTERTIERIEGKGNRKRKGRTRKGNKGRINFTHTNGIQNLI